MAPKPTKGKKEIKTVVTLQILAGRATPAPPLGPILGQNGIPIPDFCNQFNELTKDKGNDVLPVKLTIFNDNSFRILIKQPTVASMLLKTAGLEKGSANPKKEKVGTVTRAQVREIAERKLPDFNSKNLESAARTVEGSARSLGIDVID